MSNNIGENYNDEERRELSKNIFTIYQQSFFETILLTKYNIYYILFLIIKLNLIII